MSDFPNRGYYRGNLDAMLADMRRVMPVPMMTSPDVIEEIKPEDLKPGPLVHAATSLPTPQQMGYTGDTCDNCHGTRVRNNGTCKVCDDCGTTTGCS